MIDRRMGDGAGFREFGIRLSVIRLSVIRLSVIRLSVIRLSVSGEYSASVAGAGLPPKAAVPSELRSGTDKRSSVAERRRS